MGKAVVFISALLCFACFGKLQKHRFHYFAMDTLIEVTLFAGSEKKAQAALDELKTECLRIENKFSPFKETSEIKRINNRPDRGRIIIGDETAGLIRSALDYAKETEGAFDITVGPVKWLWGLGSGQEPSKPPDPEIREALKHVGWKKIRLSGDTLLFDDPETRIDVGGIAKGYALKRMAEIVRRGGISSFLINAGGDIIAGDPKPGGEEWLIAIQHPRRPDGFIRKERLSNTCIVTSGDYERFFIEDGIRYHHIFDPATGYPARGLISATVVSDDPIRADVYSTALIAAGKKWDSGPVPGVRKYIVYDDSLREFSRLGK